MITPRKARPGDIMLVPYWVTVERVQFGGDKVTCRHLDNKEVFDINGSALVAKCLSAGVYDSEKAISRTEMIELLETCYNKPFTVVFEKIDGEIRTLRGRYIGPEPKMGRSYVHDFDAEDGRPRQVDHRTMSSLIVDNVCYTIKGK